MQFEHLKLLDVAPAITNADLLHLGRINVLCGKNGSGKSTILDAIRHKSWCGKSLTLGELGELKPTVWEPRGKSTKNAVSDSDLDAVTGITNFWSKYDRALDRILSVQPIWFFGDHEQFAEKLEEELRAGNKIAVFDKVELDFRGIFDTLLKHDSERVGMLPPKREVTVMEPQVADENPSAQANGRGLTSVLFWLKSQAQTSEAFRYYQELQNAFLVVSDGHSFNLTLENRNLVQLRFSHPGSEEIAADRCGLGLHDLLLILYFALSKDYSVLLIEEPENHMHPDMQRRLLRFLRENTDKQYFLTTHSNVYLNSTYIDRVFFTEIKAGSITTTDASSRARVLHNLGYAVTDNLVSDLIILVEGPSDKEFIEEFLAKEALDARFNIKIWILGGDSMVHQDLSVFGEKHKVLAIVDRDPKSSRDDFIKNCKRNAIDLTRLERYSIESYLSKRALNVCFNSLSQTLKEVSSITDKQFTRLPKTKPIWESLSSELARQKHIKGRLKKNLRDVAREMKLSEIKGTDLEDFLKKIKKTLQN